MKMIDAHAHVFNVVASLCGKGELRYVNGETHWSTGERFEMVPPGMGEGCFTADTLAALLKKEGVEKAILLQGGLYGFQNDATFRAAQDYPDLFIPSATYDPFCREAEAIADNLIARRGVRVVKFEVSTGVGLMSIHEPFPLDGGVFELPISLLEKQNGTLVLDIGSYGMPSYQPEAVANIAKAHPSLRIVVCHLTAPTLKDEEHMKDALRTMKAPNIWFDLAAVPWNVEPEVYPYPTGQRYVRIAKDLVGSEKLLWGTDVPCVLTRESYRNLVRYLIDGNVFTPSELDGVYYGNAVSAYGL